LFQQILSARFVEQAYQQAQCKFHRSVYSPLVVMWLLIRQRLDGAAPLEAAVLDLLQGLPACLWPNPCKRIRDWRESGKPVSANTAAYNQARQKLPLSVVEQSCDHIFDQLMARMASACAPVSRGAFLLDGSSLRLAYSPALARSFPPASNQHGESHWPTMRVLVAHDLQSGLAMRPEWGPMYGPEAVSEQQLLETAIGRLPQGAVVVGDCNFGVFSVAWTAAPKGYGVVLRLTSLRAQRLAGEALRDGIDREITWKPSRQDRKSHPDLPAEACVRGRLIVRQVQPDNRDQPFLLALFATLSDPAEQILQLYGQRWNIETDLRTLKSQLRMEQLSCATPEMAAKEIEMGMAAYNLARAVICLAAQQSGRQPRDYSFTRAARMVQTFAPKIASAGSEQQAQRHFDRMMYFLQQARLPRRKRKSYPRAAWGTRPKFPKRRN
jgi:putative transposase